MRGIQLESPNKSEDNSSRLGRSPSEDATLALRGANGFCCWPTPRAGRSARISCKRKRNERARERELKRELQKKKKDRELERDGKGQRWPRAGEPHSDEKPTHLLKRFSRSSAELLIAAGSATETGGVLRLLFLFPRLLSSRSCVVFCDLQTRPKPTSA